LASAGLRHPRGRGEAARALYEVLAELLTTREAIFGLLLAGALAVGSAAATDIAVKERPPKAGVAEIVR